MHVLSLIATVFHVTIPNGTAEIDHAFMVSVSLHIDINIFLSYICI